MKARNTLHYEQAGPADGRDVLLLVHGFPFSSEMWRPQLDDPPPGWRVIAPDLPGFGASAPISAGELSMEAAADQVAMLMNTLRLGSAVVCGLSMGGYVSFALLRRYPALLRGLVLCDTRAGPDTDDARRGRLESAAAVRSDGTGKVVDTMLPKLLSPLTRKRRPEVEQQLRSIMEAAPPAAVSAALLGMAARPDSTPLLRTITVPTVVIMGEDDAIVQASEAQLMTRAIPGAYMQTVPDAGHVPNLENPQLFNRMLGDFLAALS